jgi:hypothetical protein
VSPIALKSGAWAAKFFKEQQPKDGKFQRLVEAAKHGGTLSEAEALLAEHIGDVRRRIHAGGYTADGGATFSPPYSNAHEARKARDDLDVVLTAILRWPPVAALT